MKHLENFVSRMLRAQRTFDSGMVALIPEANASLDLAHFGVDALPPEELHITLRYLGPTMNWSSSDQMTLIEMIASMAEELNPVMGIPWAIASLNPNGEHACCALIVGGLELTQLHDHVVDKVNSVEVTASLPVEHSPWVPHITLGYGVKAETVDTAKTGNPVKFDRLRVGFSENYTDFYL